MSDIERIQRYIDKTKGDTSKYQMKMNELWALVREASQNPAETVFLAFDYGRAKGFRAAKAEAARV